MYPMIPRLWKLELNNKRIALTIADLRILSIQCFLLLAIPARVVVHDDISTWTNAGEHGRGLFSFGCESMSRVSQSHGAASTLEGRMGRPVNFF